MVATETHDDIGLMWRLNK